MEEYISPLGTKEHWESQYLEELNQFHNNKTQVGEIWFGADIQKKELTYLMKHYTDKKMFILDIGFGNGTFLYKLGKNKYENLYGIDYATASLQLAGEIIKEKEKKHNEKYNIHLYQEDINDKKDQIGLKFDLIHDKGSIDAFLLNKDNKLEKNGSAQ